MRAVLQSLSDGKVSVVEVPPPGVRPGGIVVRNVASLISAGTEKAIIELAKMNPIDKARARPDLVRKVLTRASQEGLLGTAGTVLNLLSTSIPLGYSCSGIVSEVGQGVTGYRVGDRVACGGLGYANHAEVVFVPTNLVVPMPANASFEQAAFVTVGAVALHGLRQAELSLGETVVVLGLGLVGMLVAQIGLAAGLRVFGLDVDAQKVELAREMGVEGCVSRQDDEVVAAVRAFTRSRGADAILIAAATRSSGPVALAARLARDRAKVVALGDVPLNVPRRDYYEKELELRLSRSYGPGRYDPSYENKGHDYPIGYVRWTENRNMEAFLDLVAQDKIRLDAVTTHRYPIERAAEAYQLLEGGHEPYLGIVLDYDAGREQARTISLRNSTSPSSSPTGGKTVRVGVIGAGQFAQGILLPSLRKVRSVAVVGVATESGLTSRAVAEKYRSELCTSDYRELLARPDVEAVVVATRHSLHAGIVCDALEAGKHVFVEKPLAVSEQQLLSVVQAYRSAGCEDRGTVLMVGFNRRFSPLAAELKRSLPKAPLVISCRVNAGPIEQTHWVQDPEIGGGRIVGEVCHYVDLMQFLTDSEPTQVFSSALCDDRNVDPDNVCAQIRFANGSLGTITYVANGDPGFAKERVEVFGGGLVGVIDNWRKLQIRSSGRHSTRRSILWAQKGHKEELQAFVTSALSQCPPIPLRSFVLTTLTTLAIRRSIIEGQRVAVDASPVINA